MTIHAAVGVLDTARADILTSVTAAGKLVPRVQALRVETLFLVTQLAVVSRESGVTAVQLGSS